MLNKVLLLFLSLVTFKVDASIFGYIYDNVISYNERCDHKWVPNNVTGLKVDLRENVFGQPFIEKLIIPALELHLSEKHQPKKPLVLSFHGWPGTGKNYATDYIVKNIFRDGLKSQFKHYFLGRNVFPNDNVIEFYKKSLKESIETAVKLCDKSLFLFDEIDKIPVGIFDVLKPFMDYNQHIDGVDYRRSIFIFISNTGALEISSETEIQNGKGLSRMDFPYKPFEKRLVMVAYNEGGLKYSSVIKHHLIDLYVPFLPLEKRHIEKCIRYEAEKLGVQVSADLINNVMENMDFGPAPHNLFSLTGCKTIMSRVNIYSSKSNWFFHDDL